MKKLFTAKNLSLLLLVLIFVVPHFAFADTTRTVDPTTQVATGGTTFGNVVGWLITPVAMMVLKTVSLITGLSGVILNKVIDYTVVQVSQNYGGLPVINTAWATVRDVTNMGFIFVLLWASIQLILGEGKDTRKLIVRMIVAAILINFSLFFTKVIIDASNIVALIFYHAIVPVGPTSVVTDTLGSGLSNALMEPLKLASIWNMAGGLNPANIATVGVLGSILSLIAAFVFFSAAIMFVIRYVVLIMVLILSPIAFLFGVIPAIGGIAKQWWEALIGQALFAPVYMLLTWITISIFQKLPGAPGSLANALAGTVQTVGVNQKIVYDPSTMSLLFNFAVVIVFLIMTIVLAKQVAGKSGGALNKLTGIAGNLTFGAAASVSRRSLGAIGGAVARNEKLKEMDAKGGLGGMAARLQLAAGRKAAGASFDFRGTALGGAIPDAGKAGGKGGYDQMIKDQAKKKEDAIKALAPSDTVVDRAKQNLDKLKNVKTDSEEFKKELESERIKRKDGVDKLTKERELAQTNHASVETLEKISRRIETAEKGLAATETGEKYKAENVAGAQADLDKLQGVDDKEVEKRIKERLIVEGKATADNADKTTKEHMKTEEGKAEIKALKMEGAGKIRADKRALDISNPSAISLDRVFLVGKIKQSSLQAAANLRKNKKDTKTILEGILKESGEIKEEKPKEEGAPETSARTEPKEAPKT